MLKKNKNIVDSLDSRSSTLRSQANHEKVIDIATTSIIPNNIIDIQDNNIICEAIGCSQRAINEIKVEIGKYGTISLFLCTNCLPKFTSKGGK